MVYRQKVIKPMRISIRAAYREEWDSAMALAWRTFMQFLADDYTDEGVESFKNFVTDNMLHKMFLMGEFRLFGAFDNGVMVGMISLRSETHISLLFVDRKYHLKGIGRLLINYVSDYVQREEGHGRITVNSSPYAVGFYHSIGFTDTGAAQTSQGVTYTPMELFLGHKNNLSKSNKK